jgi:[lysine-biosynthesis-protein LysW]--L-2-aminoadipate ligase
VLYDTVRWEEKALIEAARKKNVEVKPVMAQDLSLDLNTAPPESFGDVVLQRCVSYYRSIHLTGYLEYKGVKVVNNLATGLLASNKLLSTLAFVKHKIPTPHTYLATNEEGAIKALESLGYPAVIKPVMGSWGRLIAKVDNPETARAILEHREQLSPLYQIYYLQKHVKRPPRDIRSFVIGDSVPAAIYRYAGSTDWRTNTARGGKAVNCPVTPELEELSLKAAKVFDEGIFGVDCMESDDGLLVHEVNNIIEFKNTVPATGVDIPGLVIDYLKKKYA